MLKNRVPQKSRSKHLVVESTPSDLSKSLNRAVAPHLPCGWSIFEPTGCMSCYFVKHRIIAFSDSSGISFISIQMELQLVARRYSNEHIAKLQSAIRDIGRYRHAILVLESKLLRLHRVHMYVALRADYAGSQNNTRSRALNRNARRTDEIAGCA